MLLKYVDYFNRATYYLYVIQVLRSLWQVKRLNGYLCDYEAGKEAKAQVDASKGEQQARNSEMNNFDTISFKGTGTNFGFSQELISNGWSYLLSKSGSVKKSLSGPLASGLTLFGFRIAVWVGCSYYC